MQAYKPQHTGAAALVLRALKAMGCATKQQLAQATGLSVMAAGTAVEHLMEKGRVLVRGRAAACRRVRLPCRLCARLGFVCL